MCPTVCLFNKQTISFWRLYALAFFSLDVRLILCACDVLRNFNSSFKNVYIWLLNVFAVKSKNVPVFSLPLDPGRAGDL